MPSRCKSDQIEPGGRSASNGAEPLRAGLRTERNSCNRAVLGQANPPLRRTVGEMGDVDVAAQLSDGAERDGPQRAKLGDDGLLERKLRARLHRDFRAHAI